MSAAASEEIETSTHRTSVGLATSSCHSEEVDSTAVIGPNGTFTLYHWDADGIPRNLTDFLKFFERDTKRSELNNAWDNSLRKEHTSKKEQLSRFFYSCVALYLEWKKRSDERHFGQLEMFEYMSASWKYYADILTRVLLAATKAETLDEVMANSNVLRKWVKKGFHHIRKLMEMGRNLSLCDDYMSYFEEHEMEIDVNMLWYTVIVSRSGPNLDVFRFLFTRFHDLFKRWNCKDGTLETPLTLAKKHMVPSIVSCIDAFLRDQGSAEWRESAAMKIGRRAAETKALALSTLKRMRKECGTQKAFDQMMECIARTVASQIGDEVAFSHDLFAMADLWQHSKSEASGEASTNAVTDTVLSKAKEILDCRTVSKRPVSWKFAKQYLVSEHSCLTALLDEDFSRSVAQMCSEALLAESQWLKAAMHRCVTEHRSAYAELCDASDMQSTAASERANWRQDTWFLDEGLNQTGVRLQDLEFVSLRSTSPDFDAKATYDLNSYLNSLLTDAHILDPLFRKKMQRLKEEFAELRDALLQFGPVKAAGRCKAKAMEDKKSKWPKTATLIDLLRCSLTFDSAEQLLKAVRLFKASLCGQRVADAKSAEATEENLSLELVRIKNGFSTLEGSAMQVPRGYCDVKLNVAIRGTVNGCLRAIIGEVQFLLRPMLESKKRNHEIYEVKRNIGGLLKDARKAYANNFAKPTQLVRSALTTTQMSSLFVHYSDAPEFEDKEILNSLLETVAFGRSYKLGLFETIVRKYRTLSDATLDTCESGELLADDFLAFFLEKRAANENLADWIQEIQKLFGDASFEKHLSEKDRNGYCPLNAYINVYPDNDKLSADVFRMLIPKLAATNADDAHRFWNDTCTGFVEGWNPLNICARAALKCISPQPILDLLLEACGREQFDSFLRGSNPPLMQYMSIFIYCEQKKDIGFETLCAFVPSNIAKADTDFWNDVCCDSHGNLLHIIAAIIGYKLVKIPRPFCWKQLYGVEQHNVYCKATSSRFGHTPLMLLLVCLRKCDTVSDLEILREFIPFEMDTDERIAYFACIYEHGDNVLHLAAKLDAIHANGGRFTQAIKRVIGGTEAYETVLGKVGLPRITESDEYLVELPNLQLAASYLLDGVRTELKKKLQVAEGIKKATTGETKSTSSAVRALSDKKSE